MQKVVEFLQKNPVQYLATVGRDGKAKCRPFMFGFEQDGKFAPPELPLYTELYDIVKSKEYFVMTTNVDHQFYKAGFDENRIFAT